MTELNETQIQCSMLLNTVVIIALVDGRVLLLHCCCLNRATGNGYSDVHYSDTDSDVSARNEVREF